MREMSKVKILLPLNEALLIENSVVLSGVSSNQKIKLLRKRKITDKVQARLSM